MAHRPDAPWLRVVLILTVTAVWAASFVADFIVDGYEPSPLIHGAMLITIGAVLGISVVRPGGKDE